MIPYPKIIDQIDEANKLVLLAREFGIPCSIKTVTKGDCEWGSVGTFYDVDYCDFDMTDEELEELVDGGRRVARSWVANHLPSNIKNINKFGNTESTQEKHEKTKG